ncbi:radical SAM protein [candidate division WOR-3 bacterium 4484_100]|uniref:Radical SAM protein n=1 Tax=candidate division WOR-3 bacterium 4484_100 TaxID=1936077 RepID=A0A1V4QGJ3_UNCW3|nr:MAG: radical SAM protein [candidate division WOR-3 bacterium 4484_100]
MASHTNNKRKITPDLIEQFYDLFSPCRLCPRECRVERKKGELGNCRAGQKLKVASYHQHFGEEPPLVGKFGSGTIFFSHCNLHCVFCQNYEISQLGQGRTISTEELAQYMLNLQTLGCHNINLVTPTPWIPQIVEALSIAQTQGLHIPIVYNCGGYESVSTLKLLEGIIDIYMPDIKYSDDRNAEKYSKVQNYWSVVKSALKEMYRQVGNLKCRHGIAESGLLIRHLVLPNSLAGTRDCFKFIAEELSKDTVVNVMAQYYPTFNAYKYPEINRRIKLQEYREALNILKEFGLDSGFQQTIDTIYRKIIPEWGEWS